MVRIKRAIPLEEYRLKVKFNTNEEGIFDLKLNGWLEGAIFSKLKDKNLFAHVMIDEVAGTICWPNGIDMCTDVIYKETQFMPQNVDNRIEHKQKLQLAR